MECSFFIKSRVYFVVFNWQKSNIIDIDKIIELFHAVASPLR